MKKISIKALAVLFLFASCDSVSTDKIGKVKSEEKLVEEYCKESSDNNFYRAHASVTHPDLGASEYSAIIEAKALLAENIQQKVKFVVDRHAETITNNGLVNYTNLQEGITRFSGEVNLGDVKVICSKVIRMQEEGMYQRFVAIEMSKEAVIKDIENKISEDDAMYQDYRRSEMRKILDSEL